MRALPLASVATVVLAAVAAFHVVVLQPLHERHGELQAALARQVLEAGPAGPLRAGEKLDAFYKAVDKPGDAADWLGSLHRIGDAAGVELQRADYRMVPAAGPLERYEMVLPVSGSYGQLREFVQRALAEVPVLSIDDLVLKRAEPAAPRVDAELRMTLYRLRK